MIPTKTVSNENRMIKVELLQNRAHSIGHLTWTWWVLEDTRADMRHLDQKYIFIVHSIQQVQVHAQTYKCVKIHEKPRRV